MNTLQDTPRANRIHIGLFGKRNSGKSSLINALTGQEAALVSEVAGTTTDPVYKPMEIHGLGPCVFIDWTMKETWEHCASGRLSRPWNGLILPCWYAGMNKSGPKWNGPAS